MDPAAYLRAVRALARDADRTLERLELPKHWRALNVHSYALPAYEAFLRRFYATPERRVAAIAMNPGKNGAVQTGIPFTDWPRAQELVPGLGERVDRAAVADLRPHREQSGRRVYAWGLARFGGYEALFREVLVLLTCPIAVLEGAGTRAKNVPLDALPRREGRKVLDLIAAHAPRLLEAARPRGVLLLGAYAEGVWQVLRERGAAPALPVARALHPAAHVPDPAWRRAMDAAWRRLERAAPGARA